MTNNKRLSVSICIESKDLVPASVAEMLDVPLKDMVVKGYEYEGYVLKVMSWRPDCWSFAEEGIESKLVDAVRWMSMRRGAVIELAKQARIDIFCGYASQSGQGGLDIPHQLLQEVGALPVNLVLDLYPPTAGTANG